MTPTRASCSRATLLIRMRRTDSGLGHAVGYRVRDRQISLSRADDWCAALADYIAVKG